MMGGGHNELRAIAIDFILALSLIWSVALAASFTHSRAHAERLPAMGLLRSGDSDAGTIEEARVGSVYAARRASAAARQGVSDPELAPLSLSLALAALVAFNLAFWRHLRRAYASPRRGRWRRS